MLIGGFARETHIKGGVAAYIKQELADTAQLIATIGDQSKLKCKAILIEVQFKKRLLVLGAYTDLQMQTWMKELTS